LVEVEAEQTKWKFLFKQNLLQQPKNFKTRILFQELAINGLWEIYCCYISRKTKIRLIKTKLEKSGSFNEELLARLKYI
jgi:hypothetical protein